MWLQKRLRKVVGTPRVRKLVRKGLLPLAMFTIRPFRPLQAREPAKMSGFRQRIMGLPESSGWGSLQGASCKGIWGRGLSPEGLLGAAGKNFPLQINTEPTKVGSQNRDSKQKNDRVLGPKSKRLGKTALPARVVGMRLSATSPLSCRKPRSHGNPRSFHDQASLHPWSTCLPQNSRDIQKQPLGLRSTAAGSARERPAEASKRKATFGRSKDWDSSSWGENAQPTGLFLRVYHEKTILGVK